MKGFTIIELLIAFTIIGALLMLILITLDPFEQQKKGMDASKSMLSKQIYNAIVRSYISRKQYPWKTNVATSFGSSEGSTIIHNLTAYGELKSMKTDLSSLYLIANNEDRTLSVCFIPQSKTVHASAFHCAENICYECFGENTQTTIDMLPALIPASPSYTYPHM